MGSDLARNVLDDFMIVIGEADIRDLKSRPDDQLCKRSGRGPVSVQGMILDAMDDERISRADASKLLALVQKRLNGNAVGLCKVTPDGDVIQIGTVSQE